MKKVTHYLSKSIHSLINVEGVPSCNHPGWYSKGNETNVIVTDDIASVTCKKCKKTDEFRSLIFRMNGRKI